MEAKSGRFSYYVCGTLSKKGSGSCAARYLNSKKLEGVVLDKIRAHVLTTENLTKLAEFATEELNHNSETHQEEMNMIDDGKDLPPAAAAMVVDKINRYLDALEAQASR